MQTTPYKIEEIEVGILRTEKIRSVKMTRARFIEIVEETLMGYSPDVHDELMPVAKTMPRFPFSAWINPERGCGCVVGEYLVATSEITRHNLAIEFNHVDTYSTISRMLRSNPIGKELMDFGSAIDTALANELKHSGLVDTNWEDVDLEDELGDEIEIDGYVDSIEIID